MRNGNRFANTVKSQYKKVLILPMRNGNYDEILLKDADLNCSYPTYEEWKPNNDMFIFSKHIVLILPMRNGNKLK